MQDVLDAGGTVISMQVYKEPSKRALDEQFGGEDETPPPAPGFTSPTLKLTKYSNAYMLVYVRESSWKDIMLDVSQNDIAEHVRSRLKVTLLLVCFAEAHRYTKTLAVAGQLLVSHDHPCSILVLYAAGPDCCRHGHVTLDGCISCTSVSKHTAQCCIKKVLLVTVLLLSAVTKQEGDSPSARCMLLLHAWPGLRMLAW